jgi:hypothetical protein
VRELVAVEQEAVAVRRDERGLDVVGGVLAVREQVPVGVGNAGRGRAAEAGRAQVLLLGPVVELGPGLVERVVAAAEAAEGLAGRRTERVGDRRDAGGVIGLGADSDRARLRSRPDVDDQAPPARVAGGDDEADAAPASRGVLGRFRPVFDAALRDRAQVAVPLEGRELVDLDGAD